MNATVTPVNGRDRAVLRAVAAGRAEFSPAGGGLVVDGLNLSDQFTGLRLATAGLIVDRPGPAALTPTGVAVLAAA
ncbi:MAG: hypothetical protein ABS81_17250 [Pseudonocardia sp. SCN 72-86]|nr:MAG: hypothetical protein ABS81_17250 [Pseudonocardia sp. SCN 72-86]